MHILYIHQYFATPNGHTGTRSYEFARRWVRAGHRVTMLTSTAQLVFEDVPGGRLDRRCSFDLEGIRVIGLPVRYSQTMGRFGRIMAFVRFMLASLRAAMGIKDVDIVFATSTPLTVGVPALMRRWLKGTPYVFEVRDLWPAIPHELGYLPGGPVLWLLKAFERRVYRGSAGVVALSPGMRDGVVASAGERVPVIVVPNCCDTDRFRPDIDGSAIRREFGWGDRFVCIHVGAIGMANGLDFVLDVADHVRDDPDYLFVLIGEGRERPRLEAMIAERGLNNVVFTGPMPKARLPEVWAAADVALVIFAPFPILEHNSANKLFDSLSAGRAVLLNYSGWQREQLEAVEAGMGCAQGDVAGFVANLYRLKGDASLRQRMGGNARQLAEKRFNRDAAAGAILDFLQQAQA